jgi:hypothetical protein
MRHCVEVQVAEILQAWPDFLGSHTDSDDSHRHPFACLVKTTLYLWMGRTWKMRLSAYLGLLVLLARQTTAPQLRTKTR